MLSSVSVAKVNDYPAWADRRQALSLWATAIAAPIAMDTTTDSAALATGNANPNPTAIRFRFIMTDPPLPSSHRTGRWLGRAEWPDMRPTWTGKVAGDRADDAGVVQTIGDDTQESDAKPR